MEEWKAGVNFGKPYKGIAQMKDFCNTGTDAFFDPSKFGLKKLDVKSLSAMCNAVMAARVEIYEACMLQESWPLGLAKWDFSHKFTKAVRVSDGNKAADALLTGMNAKRQVIFSAAGPTTAVLDYKQALQEKRAIVELVQGEQPRYHQVDTVDGLCGGLGQVFGTSVNDGREDVFHVNQRYKLGIKLSGNVTNTLAGSFRLDMAWAILPPYPPDLGELKKRYMASHSITSPADLERGGKHHAAFGKYFKDRGRRFVPNAQRLVMDMDAVVRDYEGKVCPITKRPLVTPILCEVHNRQRALAAKGRLTDPFPVESMYLVVGRYKDGWPKYQSLRGASQLESFHAILATAAPGFNMSPEVGHIRLLTTIDRWNYTVGCITVPERFCNYGTFDHIALSSADAPRVLLGLQPLFPKVPKAGEAVLARLRQHGVQCGFKASCGALQGLSFDPAATCAAASEAGPSGGMGLQPLPQSGQLGTDSVAPAAAAQLEGGPAVEVQDDQEEAGGLDAETGLDYDELQPGGEAMSAIIAGVEGLGFSTSGSLSPVDAVQQLLDGEDPGPSLPIQQLQILEPTAASLTQQQPVHQQLPLLPLAAAPTQGLPAQQPRVQQPTVRGVPSQIGQASGDPDLRPAQAQDVPGSSSGQAAIAAPMHAGEEQPPSAQQQQQQHHLGAAPTQLQVGCQGAGPPAGMQRHQQQQQQQQSSGDTGPQMSDWSPGFVDAATAATDVVQLSTARHSGGRGHVVGDPRALLPDFNIGAAATGQQLNTAGADVGEGAPAAQDAMRDTQPAGVLPDVTVESGAPVVGGPSQAGLLGLPGLDAFPPASSGLSGQQRATQAVAAPSSTGGLAGLTGLGWATNNNLPSQQHDSMVAGGAAAGVAATRLHASEPQQQVAQRGTAEQAGSKKKRRRTGAKPPVPGAKRPVSNEGHDCPFATKWAGLDRRARGKLERSWESWKKDAQAWLEKELQQRNS
ncbi:hypothetical protein N2152v2_001369 [Parachlorella kessleri]